MSTRTQIDSINEKCYKTQGYIRSLLREETNLNENLSRVEDENGQLESNISQMEIAVGVNVSAAGEKDKDCQELRFNIANKELEKKKIENQAREKWKQIAAEKEK